MTTPSIAVREATEEELEHVVELLDANDLPHRDVRTSTGRFLVGTAAETVVAAGGVEPYGSNGLVRSLVVAESDRGRGFGSALYDELEDHARKNDVDALYLLTTTASGFFGHRGYRVVDRETVPTAIRQTSQFTELCPGSATCMAKRLQ